MRKVGVALVIALACFGLGKGAGLPPTLADGPIWPVTLESDEQGLKLSWQPAAYELSSLEIAGVSYNRVTIPGLPLSAEAGYPQLPFYSGLVGLPAGGGARLRVTEIEQETLQLPHPPLPAPAPQPVHLDLADPSSLPTAGPTARRPDPAVYGVDDFYPAEVAQLGAAQQARYWRVAPLAIYPIQVNPVTGELKVTRSLRLEIIFEQPAAPALATQTREDAFSRALAATLLNPGATRWPGAPAAQAAPARPDIAASAAGATLKIIVAEAGLYALGYNDLRAAGLPVDDLDPRTLQLSHGWPRQETAIVVAGEADGKFNPGDRLLFYAEPEFSRFVSHDVYFLSYGAANGLRMSSRSGNPAGLPAGVAWRRATAEVNQFYESLYPGRDGDRWYWAELRRPDKPAGVYPILLDAPLNSGPDATLTLWLQGSTDPDQNPDHHVAISVNGVPVGQKIWNGKQAIEASFALSSTILQAGSNQITLSLPGLSGVTVEGVWLDALAITYPSASRGQAGQLRFQGEAGQKAYTLTGWSSPDLAVYDITDAYNPRRVTDYVMAGSGGNYTLTVGDATVTPATPATYLVVPNTQLKTPLALAAAKLLDDPASGADYIVITHPALANAVAPLAAHRAAQGLRVATVDVEAIYDTYGAGRMEPEAIKRFLQHAYSTWPLPKPLYVLLVGDGSYDFKNHSGWNPTTFIPPYLAEVDPWLGETAADNRYVTVFGSDLLPDLLIGRLAVTSSAETTTVVDKIIQYEANPLPGDWNSRQLFVTDDPDRAGNNFHADADQAYNMVAAPFTGYRFYYSPNNGSQPYFYKNGAVLRTAFLSNFNYGASLITFHGHSSWHQWAEEQLLRWSQDPELNDVIKLNNGYRLPVVLEMTCFTGFFHHPEYPTLDESLLRQVGGGAVAVWGATGLGVSTGHNALQAGFYKSVLEQGQTNLGAAILAGKLELAASGFSQDLLDTFMLFGDPALTLNFTITPFDHHLYLPFVGKS
jgi:hypothetical protein